MTSIDGEMLSSHHRKDLDASAIEPAIIAERGYETITNPKALPLQFRPAQRERHGMLIPIRDVTGKIANWQTKPDDPRIGANGKPIKYETAQDGRTCIDVPAGVLPYLRDAERRLWITEGCKKVDSGISNGISCIVGVLGVDGWSSNGMALPDWKEIALRERTVILSFDSDAMTNGRVRSALERFASYLDMHGAHVRYLLMPDLPDGSKCGLDDWFASGKTVLDLEACILDTLPGSVMDWDIPLPFDDPAGPEFDSALLPGAIGDYVDAVAHSTQTPPGMAAVMALGTMSAAVRGRYEVFIPEHHWNEPVLIQAVVFALPGERKSAVVKEVTHPLTLWERSKRVSTEAEAQEWESQRRVLQKHLDSAEGDINKPKQGKESTGDPDLIRQAAVQALREHMRRIVSPLRIVADDITPEKAKELMVEQRGALAIVSAEGTFFLVIIGRYAKQGSPPIEVMLQGHAAEPIMLDRKSGPSLYVPRSYLTIAVACQPDVAVSMGAVGGFRERGGTARILPAFLRSNVGRRTNRAIATNESLRQAWRGTIEGILNHAPPQQEDDDGYLLPCRLELAPAAYEAFQRYRTDHEPRLLPTGDLGEIADWGSKQPGAVLRIAGLLHVATTERPEDHRIPPDTIRRAIGIGEYFAAHAKVMYRLMGGHSGHSAAWQVLDVIRDLGSPTTKREVHRKLQDRVLFRTSGDLDDPLALLVDYGWIRTEREGKSLAIFLNPYENPDVPDISTKPQRRTDPLSGLSVFPRESQNETPTPIRVEPLTPTGTDGAFPGEFKL